MRKSLVLAFSAAVLLAPAAAFAIDGTVDINGAVAEKCLFAVDGDTVTIVELAKTTGAANEIGRLDPTTVNSQTAALNGWCNGTAAEMSVEAFPLLNATTAPTGFSNRVDFTATATAAPDGGDVDVSDTTTVLGGSAGEVVGIFSSDIAIAFSNAAAPSDGLLIAGPYTGSVVVTLTPAD